MAKWIGIDENAFQKGVVGFVYMMTYIKTGQKYIGKKSVVMNVTRNQGKYLNGKPKKVKKIKQSNWRTYYSSHQFLKQVYKTEGADVIKREILCFCYTKKELTYREIEYQMKYDVLNDDNFLNDNISGRFFLRDVEKWKEMKNLSIEKSNLLENE